MILTMLGQQQNLIYHSFNITSSLSKHLILSFTGGWRKDDRVWATLCVHHQSKEREFSGYSWASQTRYMLCVSISFTIDKNLGVGKIVLCFGK